MLEYLADEVIEQALDVGRIPSGAFTSAKLLTVASRALKSYIAPLLVAAQQDYYSADVDFPLGATSGSGDLDGGAVLDGGVAEWPLSTAKRASYRVPSRAVGGAIREVSFIGPAGDVIDVPRIGLDDLERASWGFTLQGGLVRYVNRRGAVGPVTLRMTINVAPSLLCQAASAAVVASAGDGYVVLAAPSPPHVLLPLPSPASPASFASVTSFDFIAPTPGFELVAMDVPASWDGVRLSFAALSAADFAGCYVAPARYSPVPQCPEEMIPLLVQRVVVDLLSQLGQADDMKSALEVLARIEKDTKAIISNRTPGAPLSLMTRNSIFEATRRW